MATFNDVLIIFVIGGFFLLWTMQSSSRLRTIKIGSTQRILGSCYHVLTILLFYIPAFIENGVKLYENDEIVSFSKTIGLAYAYMNFTTTLVFLLSYLLTFFVLLRILIAQTIGTTSTYILEFVSIFHFLNLIRYITYFIGTVTYSPRIFGFSDAILPISITVKYKPLLGFYIYALSVVVLVYITVDTILKQRKNQNNIAVLAEISSEKMAKTLS